MKQIKPIFLSALLLAIPGVAAQAQGTFPPVYDREYDHKLVEPSDLVEFGLVRNGNAADNNLGGTRHQDSFSAKQGNDLLVGYEGHDVYSFGAGHGLDTIIDHSAGGNTIKFIPNVDPDQITESLVGGRNGEKDRVIAYGPTDAIRIVGWSRIPESEQNNWKIEFIPPVFANETPKSRASERTMLALPTVVYPFLIGLILGTVILLGSLLMRRR